MLIVVLVLVFIGTFFSLRLISALLRLTAVVKDEDDDEDEDDEDLLSFLFLIRLSGSLHQFPRFIRSFHAQYFKCLQNHQDEPRHQ